MNILVLAQSYGSKGGVENYIDNLCRELVNYDTIKLVLITNKNSNDFYVIKNTLKVVSTLSNTQIGKIFWQIFLLPFYVKKYKIDIVFNPSFANNFIPYKKIKQIITVHDLAEFYLLNKYDKIRMMFRKYIVMRLNVRFGDQFIVISEHTKKDFLKYFQVKESAISTIYHGCNFLPTFHSSKIEKRIENTKYFLYVGRIDIEGKNLYNLLLAINKLNSKYVDVNLILVGSDYRNSILRLKKIAVELSIDKCIFFKGYVETNLLKNYYSNAIGFVFPSVYEGFGMPLLEAMAYNTPIVCSKTGALPEIAEDAAIFFDPFSPTDIAEKMYAIIKSEDLREQLIRNGNQRLKNFTWRTTSRLTYNVINNLYNKI